MNTGTIPFNGNSFRELCAAFEKGAYYPITNKKLQDVMPLMIRKTPTNRSTA